MSSSKPEPTRSERIADRITAWSGTMAFLIINAVVFVAWIVVNTLLPVVFHFDSYPFNLLTMAVSLEAIFLAIAVLISQNRQAALDRRTMERDAAVNRLAESKIDALTEDMQVIKRMIANMVVPHE